MLNRVSPRMPASAAVSMNGIRLRESSICWSERAIYRAQQKRRVVGSLHMAVSVYGKASNGLSAWPGLYTPPP